MKIHLFTSSTDGALYDTRKKDWSKLPPLRADYAKPFRQITTTAQLRSTLRADFYPGYTVVFWTEDGASLCEACARSEYRSISSSIRDKRNDGWRIVGAFCAAECSEGETCEHCGKMLDPYFDEQEAQS